MNKDLMKGINRWYCDLDREVDKFIKWYQHLAANQYDDVLRYRYPVELRDSIEKIAVLYELKYPIDYIYSDGVSVKEKKEYLKESNREHLDSLIKMELKKYINSQVCSYYSNSLMEEDYKKMVSGILDCVMYRIIERGGSGVGPRRGFLFAREYGRDIDVPMIFEPLHGDLSSKFLEQYFACGGSFSIDFFDNYFSRGSKRKKLKIKTIKRCSDN